MVMQRRCALCGSEGSITFHHLIPRSCHRNKWFRKNFDKMDMRERGIDICRRCHSFIHKRFSEKFLARELNSLDKIKVNETVRTYIKWARKQK
jgi:epoxyqueuosine reductase QueG